MMKDGAGVVHTAAVMVNFHLIRHCMMLRKWEGENMNMGDTMQQLKLIDDGRLWMISRDGDPMAKKLFDRHYSKYHYADGRDPLLFVGPGGKMVLVLPDYTALFVWRKFISADGQKGVNCAVFRNESNYLSSQLILEAEQWAWDRWPKERLYTYINAKKIKSTNPGYCFIQAGWSRCGITKHNKLIILEKLP